MQNYELNLWHAHQQAIAHVILIRFFSCVFFFILIILLMICTITFLIILVYAWHMRSATLIFKSFNQLIISSARFWALIRLIVKLSFHIYILTRLEYSNRISWLNSISISSRVRTRWLDSTRQAIEYDVKRAKYRNFSGFSPLHYLFALSFW